MFGIPFISLKARSGAVFSTLRTILLFIVVILLVFLNCASIKPSTAFSEIYLVKVTGNSGSMNGTSPTNSTISTGYYRMCEVASRNSTLQCNNLGSFRGPDLAYAFAKRVSRPYFVILGTVFSILALLACAASSCLGVQRAKFDRVSFGINGIALIFTTVAACWQQVAVQAAVVLLPNEVKRGYRAAGLVWSSVTLLALTMFLQFRSLSEKPEIKVSRPQMMDDGSSSQYAESRKTGFSARN